MNPIDIIEQAKRRQGVNFQKPLEIQNYGTPNPYKEKEKNKNNIYI